MSPRMGRTGGAAARGFGKGTELPGPGGVPTAVSRTVMNGNTPLQAANANNGQVNITWTNGDATSQTRIYTGVTLVATANAAATSYSVTTLSSGTSHTLTVKHYKNGKQSVGSNFAAILTYPHNGHVLSSGGESWTTGANQNSIGHMGAAGNTISAAMACGSGNSYGNGGGTGLSENYNGTAWSASGNLVTSHGAIGASLGTQTSALIAGGWRGRPSYDGVSRYDGSTWSSVQSLSEGRDGCSGCGTATAAVVAGGSWNSDTLDENNNYIEEIGIATTQKFNGSSWSSTGNMVYGAQSIGMFGTQTAGAVVGGYTGDYVISTTQHFDGTSWSTSTNYPFAGAGIVGLGTQTAGFTTGGTTDTYAYDGTTWSARLSTINGGGGAVKAGSQNSNLFVFDGITCTYANV